MGTENGIPLLAVLFISNNKSKLVDIVPITSKKGKDLAKICFEACHMKGSISKEQLKEKIVGLTGDGAFAKGNSQFKDEVNLLFEKLLIFRWGILHLINRVHFDAKGVEVEVQALASVSVLRRLGRFYVWIGRGAQNKIKKVISALIPGT